MSATTIALTGVSAAAQSTAGALKPSAQQDKQSSDDVTAQDIADRVEDEFITDLAVPSYEIDVSVNDDVATLTGTVNNLLVKQRAERLARTVRGVRQVQNNISVESAWMRTDPEIIKDVTEALRTNAATDKFELDVTSNDNVVTLQGTVDSFQEKRLAGKVAMGVRGVEGVNNEIDVNIDTNRPDYEIQTEVEEALKWNAYVDSGLIDVTVDDGVVTLEGVVGSAAEHSRALVTAYVAGVSDVDASGLEVRPWSDTSMADFVETDLTDSDIRRAIENAMLYDERVNSFNVQASVEDGTVTLRGTVDNLRAKRAASSVARSIAGVDRVVNRVDVRFEDAINDAQIKNEIVNAIQRNPYVERSELTVDVIDNVAYLYGTVDTYFERREADILASSVNGVNEVVNNLAVDDSASLVFDPYLDDTLLYEFDWYAPATGYTYQADSEIQDDITDEYFWSPFIDADDVTVSVDEGVAHLSGSVDSWSEWNAAIENALEGGAIRVDNDLDIE